MKVQVFAAVVTAPLRVGCGHRQGAGSGGAKVALLDLNEDAAAATAREIGGRPCLRRSPTREARRPPSPAPRRSTASPHPGQLRRICPAAKVVGRNGPASLDAFSKVIQINLIGTFNMMRLVAAGAAGLDPLEGGSAA